MLMLRIYLDWLIWFRYFRLIVLEYLFQVQFWLRQFDHCSEVFPLHNLGPLNYIPCFIFDLRVHLYEPCLCLDPFLALPHNSLDPWFHPLDLPLYDLHPPLVSLDGSLPGCLLCDHLIHSLFQCGIKPQHQLVMSQLQSLYGHLPRTLQVPQNFTNVWEMVLLQVGDFKLKLI